ncbi:hypothetical protein ACHAW6_015726, partial [Cyclotella cf. meneghiniana]
TTNKQYLSKLKLELSEGLAKYNTFSHDNEPYDNLTTPRPFPTTVNTNAVVREQQIAEHIAEIREYEQYLGVSSWARKAIIGAVDDKRLFKIQSPHVGFNHVSPAQLLAHLEDIGGEVDYMDVTDLQAVLTMPWDHVKAPTTLFEQGEKNEKQLVKTGIPVQPQLRLVSELCWFQQSGEFNSAIREWHTKPAASKTFTAFCLFIQKEFAKHQKRDTQIARATGQGIANNVMMKDVLTEAEINAMAMAELVNVVTMQSDAQMEKMMEIFSKSLETMSNNKQSGKEALSTNQKFPNKRNNAYRSSEWEPCHVPKSHHQKYQHTLS